MEPPTPADTAVSLEEREILEAQLRECFGRVAYSHKAHEKCADRNHSRLTHLKVAQIVLSAVTTGGLIVAIFGESTLATALSAVVSALLLILNMYAKEHDLGGLAAKHSEVSADLWGIRESYLSLITDTLCTASTVDDIRRKRDDLQEELKSIYQGAPRTTPKCYASAQKALKLNEELTFSDAEIDMLLPARHRKSGRDSPPGTASSTDKGAP